MDYPDIRWLDDVEDHDYEAAENYLSLLIPMHEATATAEGLRSGDVVRYFAKDIARAANVKLLTEQNVHVAKDLAKIQAERKLSPILLVRHDPLIIADGYHRVCAAHHVDENALIPCRIGIQRR